MKNKHTDLVQFLDNLDAILDQEGSLEVRIKDSNGKLRYPKIALRKPKTDPYLEIY